MSENKRERRLKRQKNLGSLKLQTLNTPFLFLETQTQTNIYIYIYACLFCFLSFNFGGVCGGKITCLPPNQTVVVGPCHHGNRSTSILWEKRGWVDHVFDVDSTLLWGRNIRDKEKGKHNSSLSFFFFFLFFFNSEEGL